MDLSQKLLIMLKHIMQNTIDDLLILIDSEEFYWIERLQKVV